jgi:serine/threonine protein kinase
MLKYKSTLCDIIENNKTGLGLERAIRYLHGILDGIASFHKAGYIHGDLKPSNIAISYGIIKIIDFGGCSHIKLDLSKSSTNRYFRCPGLVNDKKIDLWAIGCIFV